MSLEADLRQMLHLIGQPEYGCTNAIPADVLDGLRHLIRADSATYLELDTRQQLILVENAAVDGVPDETSEPDERYFWSHYWNCAPCSYPDRTGDISTVTLMSDFYSTRQLHASGMYADYFREAGVERECMVCLPSTSGPSRRLVFFRGPGRDFSERDRFILTLLRPHLVELRQRIQRQRPTQLGLTPRQQALLELVAEGHSNRAIARQLGLSSNTVRKHLENIFDRLNVSSRTAASAVLMQAERST